VRRASFLRGQMLPLCPTAPRLEREREAVGVGGSERAAVLIDTRTLATYAIYKRAQLLCARPLRTFNLWSLSGPP